MPFNAENTIIKLHLTPENLGSLAIKVTKQEDKLTIHFYTTSHDVKEIIEASFPQLKEALFRQNLLLDEAMVLITNQEQGRGQNNNYTQGRWYSEQPYTSQNIKTKEVDLNSLTGEVDYIPNVTTINYWI
jgi:flagellar hook-length control protein FliK